MNYYVIFQLITQIIPDKVLTERGENLLFKYYQNWNRTERFSSLTIHERIIGVTLTNKRKEFAAFLVSKLEPDDFVMNNTIATYISNLFKRITNGFKI